MITELFFEHPSSVCLTYFQHWLFAMEMSGKLLKGSVEAMVHAFIPCLFIHSTSELQETLQIRLSEIGCREKKTSF